MALASKETAKKKIYNLSLTDDGSPNVPKGYVLLPPPTDQPYHLRIVIQGDSPVCRSGSLWVNIPKDAEGQFERAEFREFK